MTVTYTLRDCDTYATVYDDAGAIVGTITRPAVLRYMRPMWTVSNREGREVLSRRLRPTNAAIARALLS